MRNSGRFLVAQMPQVTNPAKFGSQAVDLARLATAGFSVPRGFAISADAYHAQVWVSGAKALSEGPEENLTRRAELVRTTEMPPDVRAEVLSAYHNLSLQTGMPDPRVAVRLSSLDPISTTGEAVNATGEEQLLEAIASIWADAWLQRARSGASGKDPGAAVYVHQNLNSNLLGIALTGDPYSGNPNVVKLRWKSGDAEHVACSVELEQMSVTADSEEHLSGVDSGLALKLAEMAILAEEALGRPAKLEWIRERDTIWLVSAEEIGGGPRYFPAADVTDTHVTAWKRVASAPVCQTCAGLAENCFQHHSLPSPDSQTHFRLENGFIYLPLYRTPEGVELWNLAQKEAGRYGKLTQVWTGDVEPALDKIRRDLPEYLSTSEKSVRIEGLSKLAEGWASALSWLCASVRPGDIYTAAIADELGRKNALGLLKPVLTGLSDPVIIRDAKLQEMADRLKAAGKADKLKDDAWWKEFRAEAAQFAEHWGYGFTEFGEVFDFSQWKSWPEDLNPIYHAIRTLAQRDNRSTIVTLHTHAVEQAPAAQAEAETLFSGAQRTAIRKAINLSRQWLVIGSKCGLSCGIYGSALRRLCMLAGNDLAAGGMIPSAEDVFQLTIQEIEELIAAKLPKEAVGRVIAHRKHIQWLRSRLDAPEYLPASANMVGLASAASRVAGAIGAGLPAVSGKAGFADSYAKAGEVSSDTILTVTEPMPGWSPFFGAVAGFVSQEPPLLPSVPILAAQYEIPAVFGCAHVGLASHGGNRMTLDPGRGEARYHW